MNDNFDNNGDGTKTTTTTAMVMARRATKSTMMATMGGSTAMMMMATAREVMGQRVTMTTGYNDDNDGDRVTDDKVGRDGT
jgi:hypothetical protein